MLITIKAGSTVDGFTLDHDSNQDLNQEKATMLLKDGRAKPVAFDAEGVCRINMRYDAWLNEHGALAVGSGADAYFHTTADFPLAYLPALLAAYHAGQHRGSMWGRIKLQSELRELLNAESAGAVIG